MNNKDNKASTKKQQNKSPNPEHFGDVWGYISTTKMSTKTRPLNLHPPKTNGWNGKTAGGPMFFEIFLLVVFSGSSW